MDHKEYEVSGVDQLITPTLFYYKDKVVENIRRAIQIAGDPKRLWPHVKSHKTRELVHLQMDQGITRFKCATIAEAEMVADCGAGHIILAYPLIGPNILRFLTLQIAYPHVCFYAIGDDLEQLRFLGQQAQAQGGTARVLVDVDMGSHRTGVPLDRLEEFFVAAAAIPGLDLVGLHCYDGNHSMADFQTRMEAVSAVDTRIFAIQSALTNRGLCCETLVMGGTPSFPCHAAYPNVFLSPGTCFLWDWGYGSKFRDLEFLYAAAILTRVVSRTTPDTFTLDLGYKGIAADPPAARGVIVGMEDTAIPLFQNEEHWVFQMTDGCQDQVPSVGDLLYVIPTHICPTSALYPFVPIVEGGEVTGHWDIAARNRKITY